MQKSDSDLACVIVLRAVVPDERLFVPLRSQFIAHLCQAPLFQVCGGKVTARSQSFTTKQNQLRQTFPSASSDYNPRMIRILVCLRETNRAAGCFHKHARAESCEGFITVQATTAYHIKQGSHSSKHPLFLWSADTIGGVWRALSSDQPEGRQQASQLRKTFKLPVIPSACDWLHFLLVDQSGW